MAPRGSSKKRAKKVAEWSWWDEVDVDESYSSGGGAKKWKCRYCNLSKTGGANRVRGHLMHVPGQEVSYCMSIPPEKKQELQEKCNTLVFRAPPPRSMAVNPNSIGGSSLGPSLVPTAPPSRGGQRTLASAWDPRRKEAVDAAVARFFYHDHIAFNAARSPYFQEMVHAIAEFGPSYTPPSSETLRTTLLKKEKAAIDAASTNIRAGWQRNGISLISDGWTDSQHRSIHGIVAYSRGSVHFVSSHDASATGKSSDVLVEEWAKAIDSLGAQDIIQVIGDGEASNKAAGTKLEERYPHITFSPCIAHGLNNLLKDIGNLEWVAPTIERGKEICNFITRHQFILSEFRKKSPNKDLLKYSETRFAYNFTMLERLHTVRMALKQLVVSEEWENWPTSRTGAGRACYINVMNDEFWAEVAHLNALVKPIIHMLRIADNKKPSIGKVYEGLDKMIEKIKDVEPNAERSEELRALCQGRWEMYHSPLHAAAFVLDPEFQGCGQETDDEVMEGWETVLSRLIPDTENRRAIKDQLSIYRSKQGRFGTADAQNDRLIVGGALWWEDYGASTPELQRLAVRILSQGCSSSPMEQLWSVFGHIASKKRNRLLSERTSDLVYVTCNLRLLSQLMNPGKEEFIEIDAETDSYDDDGTALEMDIPCATANY